MRNPAATYRVQLSPYFPLNDLQSVISYLEKFGISTIYSAPFFEATEGSTHGYDITDPFTINREIGSLKGFRAVRQLLDQKGMDWLQDIVPNHMAFDGKNTWLQDIFELGPRSRFYNFFDIDWEYKGWKKVMAPFMGGSLEEVLEKGEIKLTLDQDRISLNYYELNYPVSLNTYPVILEKAGYGKMAEKFRQQSRDDRQWEDMKNSLFRELKQDPGLRESVEEACSTISSSKEEFLKILDLQFFLPVHWKTTEEEINYRRFFTINGLICLRMEDAHVFEIYHHYIQQLCEEGLIDGLRIDHIDGLFDPEGYLEMLRKLVGEDFYIIVEKILETHEQLPLEWPVQGTSGYDFLAQVNHLFTAAKNKRAFTEAYQKIKPDLPGYSELVYQKKLFILKERMGGELHNLWLLLKDFELISTDETTKGNWMEALCSIMASFPVYRIYPRKFPLSEIEVETVGSAYTEALKRNPERAHELDRIKNLFLGRAEKDEGKMLYLLQRCQQFTGPLAAKGVEDTSFYIFNRLISHNEVGDSPENFGITVSEFHEKMQERQKNFPLSVSGTATHDTKRGEDARMRLNVLSEIPKEWFQKIEEWKGINREFSAAHNAPDDNEEYFIYQTLIGALPFAEAEQEDFYERTRDYLQKVLREAKVHSNWANPDEEYEKAVFDFIKNILEKEEFRSSFDPFQRRVALLGAIKSLGQCLIKITAPGIPDVYQGSELWDLSYVDPDNRRPIDYEVRKKYLEGFKSTDQAEQLQNLKRYFFTGQLKMYCLHKALKVRMEDRELFEMGEYLPLEVKGDFSENIIAFARRKKEKWSLTLVPVLVGELCDPEELRIKPGILKETYLQLPKDAPNLWQNKLSGEDFEADNKIKLEGIFSRLPVALLTNHH